MVRRDTPIAYSYFHYFQSVLGGNDIDWQLFGLTTHSDLIVREFLVPVADQDQPIVYVSCCVY